jgi:uncharacterized membrane protein
MKNLLLPVHYIADKWDIFKRRMTKSNPSSNYWINLLGRFLFSLIFMIATLLLSWEMGIGQSTPLRIFFGLMYLGVFPGDALLCLLFPGKSSINFLEQFVFIILLSIGIITLIGFLLNYSPWGIRLESLLFSTEILTSLFYLIAYLRARRVYIKPEATLSIDNANLTTTMKKGNKKIQITTLITSMLSFLVLILLLVAAGPKEKYTEFFFLNRNNNLGIERNNYSLGEKIPLNFVVINHEGSIQNYHLLLIENDGAISIIANIKLDDQKQWNQIYVLNLIKLGENQIYKFVLYREGDSEPYRSLQIVLSVKENTDK